jgi:Carboxypeptidase regulatory-like domain
MSRASAKFLLFVLLFALFSLSVAFTQTSISTGSISGTVTDASGAVVPNAKATISGPTGQTLHATTSQTGAYSVGALIPGVYMLRVEAKGFKTTQVPITVQIGNTANGSVKLEIGQESTVVEVQGTQVEVNTEQATVQGVLTAIQIENLPVNGRNFLDLAQLEPGVQIQDGQNFDPTKAGYSSISFGGRFGRTARIEVDGVDVSDETVGTTTTDIPASAIQEFQVSQSSLDMSSELTSSGSVNVTTKSGTNAIHGGGFGAFRDSAFSSQLPTPVGFSSPYQRSQYGGNLGGPIIKDKLYYFLDGERTIQHTQVPVPIDAPFQSYSGTFADPFHEGNLLARADYQLTKTARLFDRFSYFKNDLGATFGYGFSLYDNIDITRNELVGLDFNTGSFTHSIRFSFLKFQNQIIDATTGNSALPFDDLHAELFAGNLVAGPNLLAPQSTPQSDHEIKYDGGKIIGSHMIRFGVAFNHLRGGGFASFFENGPQIGTAVLPSEIASAATGPFPGGSANPFNYPADFATVANGLGYSFTDPSLGFPAGGLGPDNRILLYLGDSWKIKSNLTVTYGLRYERDTGRSDSQFAPIPELSALVPGLGDAVNQPNLNFAPQLGFAYDPWKSGKTSIRGGIGLFYENAIWNNVLFDGPEREKTGAFLQYNAPCAAPGAPNELHTVNGDINTPGSASATAICGAAGASIYPLIGNVVAPLIALQQAWVAGSPFNLQAPNPSYVGQYLTGCVGATIGSNCSFTDQNEMFSPNYKTPRSVQMNIGIQREIRPGMVFSGDYVRNVQTHYLLGVDQNHTGDVRFFNKAGALDAIAATNTSFGCAAGTSGIPCAIAAGATMANYAGNGLGSTADLGGPSCLAALGYECAFGGINPLAPELAFLSPVGRSLYSGLQTKLTENVNNPFPGATVANFQISYALSRFENTGGGVGPDSAVTAAANDQDFIIPALNNQNVNAYFGPSTLDRTHQLSFGGYFRFRGGIQWGVIGHFDSPFANTLTVPNTATGAGEIFRTDFEGSGVTQDPLPGTHVGSFDRGIDAGNINQAITNFNNLVAAHTPTPAGNVLIQNGLFTQGQLAAIGGTYNGGVPLALAPPGQVNMSWLRTFDTTLSWNYLIKEKVTITPSVAAFNLFNFVNFDLPTSEMSGLLNGQPGSINGTTYAGHFANRVGAGTGVYTLGSPRQVEFGLKFAF